MKGEWSLTYFQVGDPWSQLADCSADLVTYDLWLLDDDVVNSPVVVQVDVRVTQAHTGHAQLHTWGEGRSQTLV